MDAMVEVVSSKDLWSTVMSALDNADVAKAELVCKPWARAVARDGYWRRALARRFPSALPELAGVTDTAALHATARKAFGRLASAAARELPLVLRRPTPDGALVLLTGLARRTADDRLGLRAKSSRAPPRHAVRCADALRGVRSARC